MPLETIILYSNIRHSTFSITQGLGILIEIHVIDVYFYIEQI